MASYHTKNPKALPWPQHHMWPNPYLLKPHLLPFYTLFYCAADTPTFQILLKHTKLIFNYYYFFNVFQKYVLYIKADVPLIHSIKAVEKSLLKSPKEVDLNKYLLM